MAKHTQRPMTRKDASRIQRAGDRQPQSETARSGFGPRAQRAADTGGTTARKAQK
jgi:hypothetical protein